MVKMWSIIFLIILLGTAYSCPSVCKCVGDDAECTHRSLKDFSNVDFTRTVHKLDFSHNTITEIGEFDLRDMYIFCLKHLDLSHNAITYIHPHAFFGQSALTVVDLSWNNIRYIHLNILSYLRTIKWLSLAHNHITVPSTGAFLNSDNLEILHMEHCGIKDISFLTFWERN